MAGPCVSCRAAGDFGHPNSPRLRRRRAQLPAAPLSPAQALPKGLVLQTPLLAPQRGGMSHLSYAFGGMRAEPQEKGPLSAPRLHPQLPGTWGQF